MRGFIGLLLVALAPGSSGNGRDSLRGVNLTLLSYNARNYNDGGTIANWKGVRVHLLADVILGSGSDVVTVQEMRNSSAGDMHADLVALIGEAYPYGWWRAAMTYTDDLVEGQSYFSKTPLMQPSGEPDYLQLPPGDDDINDRIAARLLIRPASLWTDSDNGSFGNAGPVNATLASVYPGCYVSVFATHLSTDREDQLSQAEALLGWATGFDEAAGPGAAAGDGNGVSHGIIGDLNAHYEDDMATGVNNRLIDLFEASAYSTVGPQDMCTYHCCADDAQASHRDRFLVPAGNTTDARHSDCRTVGNRSISDHLGLLCTFAVANALVGERCFRVAASGDAANMAGDTATGTAAGGGGHVGGDKPVGDAHTGSVPWAVGVTVFFVIAMAVVISVKLNKFGTGREGNGSRNAGGGRCRKKSQQYKVFSNVPCGTEPLFQQGIRSRSSLSPQPESEAYAGGFECGTPSTTESDL